MVVISSKSYLVSFAPKLSSSIKIKVSSLQVLIKVLTQDQVVFTHQLFIQTLQVTYFHCSSPFLPHLIVVFMTENTNPVSIFWCLFLKIFKSDSENQVWNVQ